MNWAKLGDGRTLARSILESLYFINCANTIFSKLHYWFFSYTKHLHWEIVFAFLFRPFQSTQTQNYRRYNSKDDLVVWLHYLKAMHCFQYSSLLIEFNGYWFKFVLINLLFPYGQFCTTRYVGIKNTLK